MHNILCSITISDDIPSPDGTPACMWSIDILFPSYWNNLNNVRDHFDLHLVVKVPHKRPSFPLLSENIITVPPQ